MLDSGVKLDFEWYLRLRDEAVALDALLRFLNEHAVIAEASW